MNVVNLIIHRGSHQIGGMCIEVEIGGTRLIIDTGTPLPDIHAEGRPITEGGLPVVKGLFEGDDPGVAGVLLTHSHGDHSGLLNRVHSSIPLHLTKGASQMVLAATLFANGERGAGQKRQERTIEPQQPFRIGPFLVTAFSVDHSGYGACAFVIEGGGRRIIYSGDLRMHGPHRGKMLRMLDHPLWQEPDVLMMEGTLLGKSSVGEATEEFVQTKVREDLEKCEGLGLLMFSPQNVDRLVGMWRAVKASGRVLVVDAYTLFVLHCVWRDAKLPNPFEPENGVRVWFPDGFQERAKLKMLMKVADRLPAIKVELSELLERPSDYALVFREWMADRFPAMVKVARLVVYSYWSGYLETERFRGLKRRMEGEGIRWVHRHASGHIRHDDLLAFVRRVRPKTLVPVHTETGDDFARFLPEQAICRLKDGQVYEVDSVGN
jgi:ribonuclease J